MLCIPHGVRFTFRSFHTRIWHGLPYYRFSGVGRHDARKQSPTPRIERAVVSDLPHLGKVLVVTSTLRESPLLENV